MIDGDGDWHYVSNEIADILIRLNARKTDDYTVGMVEEFRQKIQNEEQIKVPYNHPFLRLDDSQMKELGNLAETLRTKYYAKQMTKQDLQRWRKYIGCKQGCSIATYVKISRDVMTIGLVCDFDDI